MCGPEEGGAAANMDVASESAWDSLPVKLHAGILETLEELKFSYMTPVQVNDPLPPRSCPLLCCPSSHVFPCVFLPVRVRSAVPQQQGRRCGGGEFTSVSNS